VGHPDDWVEHSDTSDCVCRWCKHGEEHHGIGREQGALLERAMILFYRVRAEANTPLSLAREVDTWLDAMDVAEDLWQR